MNRSLLNWIRKELRRGLLAIQGFSEGFYLEKKRLIDFTFKKCNPAPQSFADLGGVWAVDAAYTFYALDNYDIESAVIVDAYFTDKVIEKSQEYGNLRIIKADFGEKGVPEQVAHVDAIFLFDVLLHQVKPDWDEVLKMYSAQTDYFVVFNPQWIASDNTVRLLELGRDEYFRNVPHDEQLPTYKDLFRNMNEIHPEHRRIWRDIPDVWQWGITDDDLQRKMSNLGFALQHYKNCGQFGTLRNFEKHALIFQKL